MSMMEEEEEEAIRFYFFRGFDYSAILQFLQRYHGITMCYRTLLNRLKFYGLRRRECQFDEVQVRRCIQQELQSSGSLLGYRAMWRKLLLKYNIQVPRHTVQILLHELDPEGSELRRAHRLRRRKYINPGPNFCWHCDGYDKLKPYGFPIHGCIDGFSRRVLWLLVTKTNNDPRVIGKFFVQCVRQNEGCPRLIRTDRGTENGLLATSQCFLRRNGNDSLSGFHAHRYGSSHSNQRIEAWWSFFRKSWSNWWINFFKDMVDNGQLDTSHELQMECLWFCFSKLLQKEVDEVVQQWNSHYIRESAYHTQPGIPDQLFFLPETVGKTDHKLPVTEPDVAQVENEIRTENVDSLYDEYFSEVVFTLGMSEPTNWNESLAMYQQLLTLAE